MISQVISSLGPTLLYACTQVETKKGSGEKGNIPNRRLVIFDARSFAHFINACRSPDGLCLGRCCMLVANVQLRVALRFKLTDDYGSAQFCLFFFRFSFPGLFFSFLTGPRLQEHG